MKAVQRDKQKKFWAQLEKVYCGDFELDNVYNFTYLGHIFQGDGDHTHDIDTRLARASQTFGQLRHIFHSDDLAISVKLELFKSAVCSVLTYGNEVWVLDDKTQSKIRGWAANKLVQFVKNEDGTDRTHSQENRHPSVDIVLMLRARRLRWVGHVIRLDESRLLRQVLLRKVPGGRKPGTILMDTPSGLTTEQLIDLAGVRL